MCRCLLHGEPPEWPTFSTTDAVVAHVKAHLAIGQRVPDWTIDELRREDDANDAWIAEQDPSPDLD